MKYNQSEIILSDLLDNLDSLGPVKIIYNNKELYNDYDSKKVIKILDDGEKIYGEYLPYNISIPSTFPELLNKKVYKIDIEVVEHHHSIVNILGEK
jgi:hypothetical protein